MSAKGRDNSGGKSEWVRGTDSIIVSLTWSGPFEKEED